MSFSTISNMDCLMRYQKKLNLNGITITPTVDEIGEYMGI